MPSSFPRIPYTASQCDKDVLEFPSRAQAEAFWDDPDHQAAMRLRDGALKLQLELIEGEA